MKLVIGSLTSVCLSWLIPAAVSAQFSSENYQVDVQYVGEEGGGYATSTNYQFSGASGTPFEYDSSVTPNPDDEEGSSGSVTGTRVSQDGEVDKREGTVGEEGTPTVPGGAVDGSGSRGPVAVPSGSDGDFWGDVPPSSSQDGEMEEQSDSEIPESLAVVSSKMNIIWERIQERPYVYSFLSLLVLLLILLFVGLGMRTLRGVPRSSTPT